jgi:hypothetical protein
MCGICGVIGIEHSESGEALTRRMMQALWHRGPDEDGILVAPSRLLGCAASALLTFPVPISLNSMKKVWCPILADCADLRGAVPIGSLLSMVSGI